MAIQLSIDEKGAQRQQGGHEDEGGASAIWIAAKAIAVFGAVGRFAGQAFNRMKRARASESKRKQMKLVESLALGNRRQLLLVVCDNQRYLVGAGADSVGSILSVEASLVSRDRSARGPELVRRRGRDAGHEARSKVALEPGLDLWH